MVKHAHLNKSNPNSNAHNDGKTIFHHNSNFLVATFLVNDFADITCLVLNLLGVLRLSGATRGWRLSRKRPVIWAIYTTAMELQ